MDATLAPDVGQRRAESSVLRPVLQVHSDWPWLVMPERQVVQVATDKTLALVPNTPAWFLGVLNLRGVLIPAFDLAAWAGAKPQSGNADFALLSPGPRGMALRCVAMPELSALSALHSDQRDTLPDVLIPFLGQAWRSESLGWACSFDPWRWLDQCRDSLTTPSLT